MRKRNVKLLPSEQPPVTMDEVHDKLKGGEELDIAELARGHSEEMLDALVKMARREGRGAQRAPHAVAATAAKTVLEIGHGRTATQAADQKDTGLTIIVNNLTTGETKMEKVIDVGGLEVDTSQPVEIIEEVVNLAEGLVALKPLLRKPPE